MLYLVSPDGAKELSLAARKRAARQTLIHKLEKYGKEKRKDSGEQKRQCDNVAM